MVYSHWPAAGCTLAEARRRTIASDASPPLRDERARSQATERERSQEPDFFSLFLTWKLVAYGAAEQLSGKPFLLGPEMFAGAVSASWRDNVLQVENTRFYNIRIFPAVVAPCRADILSDLLLSEGMWKFVLHDPEVELLAKRAIAKSPGYATVFHSGWCHPHGVAEWPFVFSADDVVGVVHPDWTKRGPLGFLSTEPDPLEVIEAVAALSHRWDSLLKTLLRGEIDSEALPAEQNYPSKILRSLWRQPRFYFNLQDNSLFESKETLIPPHDWLARRYTGILLEKPQASVHQKARIDSGSSGVRSGNLFHVKPTGNDGLRSFTMGKRKRRRPVAEEVARALRECGLASDPSAFSWKEIAKIIYPKLKKPPATQTALEKAIQRHYENNRSAE
ncbi:MAG: hypothetical protein E6G97_21980 [Alphaproteobacteria bacterium]|nr:MAG: hypothetical protein E6G97_21980 [Alphaproteobacteria bacterium]